MKSLGTHAALIFLTKRCLARQYGICSEELLMWNRKKKKKKTKQMLANKVRK